MLVDRNQRQTCVKKVMNIWVPNKWETLRICAMEFFSSERLNFALKFMYVTSML